MHLFRDDALLRRAIGAALVFGLLGRWAQYWREDSYPGDHYAQANNLVHTFGTLAIVAVIYVAVCLLLTPRTTTTRANDPVAATRPEQP